MIDTARLLNQLTGSGFASGLAGGLAGSSLLGLATSKKGRKIAGTALKVGGVALVGGLAYRAWQNHRGAQQRFPAPGSSMDAFVPRPNDPGANADLAMLLLRAMISAAKADDRIDATESRRILVEINQADLQPEEKAFLLTELSQPRDLSSLIAAVDSPEHAAEVYAVSLLTIGEQPSSDEQRYLAELARGLGLESGLVAELHREASIAADPADALPLRMA